MNGIASGVDQPRGDEDEQIGACFRWVVLLRNRRPTIGMSPRKGNFIINLLQLFRDETAQDDRLTVPNHDAGDQIAGVENSGSLISCSES